MPLSRFMELLLFLISMASIVLRSQYPCTDFIILASFQSMLQWLFAIYVDRNAIVGITLLHGPVCALPCGTSRFSLIPLCIRGVICVKKREICTSTFADSCKYHLIIREAMVTQGSHEVMCWACAGIFMTSPMMSWVSTWWVSVSTWQWSHYSSCDWLPKMADTVPSGSVGKGRPWLSKYGWCEVFVVSESFKIKRSWSLGMS